ncbi:hypothetical protein F5884DRAFT_745217 [Xylogone sp. PMI_703]|nr:hypothetical protein F5884DRAFT_745217 [Xylogone sp. PMI_703]
MAQGAIKSKKPSTATAKASGGRNSVLGPKKGARTIKPKKAALVQNAKMIKKHSAGLTALTERTLGAKAGHLEMLRGGKKDGGADKKGKDKSLSAQKGGSKKFG